MTVSDFKQSLKRVFLVALVITVIFLVFSYFLSLTLGLALFFFTEEGLTVSALPLRALPIWLFYLPFDIPIRLNVGTVFLFLWSVYALCFVAAWRFRESLQGVIRKVLSRPTKKLFGNCLFGMPIIASMTLIAIIAIHSIQESSGIPTGEPLLPENPFQAFFELSYSPLIEEIGFRVSPIGIFLIAYLFSIRGDKAVAFSWIQRLKLFVLALLYPDRAKKLVGVKTVSQFGVKGGISLGEWMMVILTAAVYGLAHYVYGGGGWQVGKITSAAAHGLVVAFTYLLYGVQAPILLHWFFNYYFAAFDLASDLYPGVFPVYIIIWVVTIILGILGWLTVIILGIRKIANAIERRTRPLEVESLT